MIGFEDHLGELEGYRKTRLCSGGVTHILICSESQCRQARLRSTSARCERDLLISLAVNIHWRREWLTTLVFSPGEFHGQKSLAGYSLWGHKKLNMTERLLLSLSFKGKSEERDKLGVWD